MKICFERLTATALFDPSCAGGIGGAEVRSYTFANGLAETGRHQVLFVVGADRPHPPQGHRQMTVHFECPPSTRTRDLPQNWRRMYRVPLLTVRRFSRSAAKRLFPDRIWQPRAKPSLAQINADVYCAFGVNNDSAHLVRSSQQIGKQSVLFLASDNDLCHDAHDGSRSIGPFGETGHLCHYALTQADAIIVQTPWQQETLRERYGRESTLIRNPINLRTAAPASHLRAGKDFALWIGREDSFAKRPDRCIDLAQRCPEVPFVMIVNKKRQDSFDELVRAAPPNVTILERVPFDLIEAYVQAASVLVNTSTLEGFPNTFLQAAKFRVPILSWTVDPAGMLSKHGCGALAHENMEEMSQLLLHLCRDRGHAKTIGRNGRRYVERFHALDGCVEELERLLKQTVAQGHSPDGAKSAREAA